MDEHNGTKAEESPQSVYFFATCVIDLFLPEAGEDAIRLLERCGLRVHFPADQSCCGQPAYTSGYAEEAVRVAAAQLAQFPEPWPIIVPSGSCGGMIRHHWPRLFERDPVLGPLAAEVAGRTHELTEYLLHHTDLDLGTLPERRHRVALHTSCTARREMDTFTHGRALLEQLPGVEYVVHEREAECCGFGGTFAVKHPDISAAMTADKLRSLRASHCDTWVSADCGCLLNLNLGADKTDERPPPGRHIASLILEQLDARESSTPATGDAE